MRDICQFYHSGRHGFIVTYYLMVPVGEDDLKQGMAMEVIIALMLSLAGIVLVWTAARMR
jgi:hypothetical protein